MDASLFTVGLAPEQRIALAYAHAADRARFAALFALDRLLGQAVSRGREPIAAQLRLAWWRDLLADGGGGGSAADPQVAAILAQWRADPAPAIAMVDGWEELLAERPDTAACASGRADPFAALAQQLGLNAQAQEGARAAARHWALVDLSDRLSDRDESAAARAQARAVEPTAGNLPRRLRPLTVLDGLARRALKRGVPLFGDRFSPLVAIRLGIFGR